VLVVAPVLWVGSLWLSDLNLIETVSGALGVSLLPGAPSEVAQFFGPMNWLSAFAVASVLTIASLLVRRQLPTRGAVHRVRETAFGMALVGLEIALLLAVSDYIPIPWLSDFVHSIEHPQTGVMGFGAILHALLAPFGIDPGSWLFQLLAPAGIASLSTAQVLSYAQLQQAVRNPQTPPADRVMAELEVARVKAALGDKEALARLLKREAGSDETDRDQQDVIAGSQALEFF
jgi:hypothetical protein